jgi:hypothetical protein
MPKCCITGILFAKPDYIYYHHVTFVVCVFVACLSMGVASPHGGTTL